MAVTVTVTQEEEESQISDGIQIEKYRVVHNKLNF
jgi:hypothetical protein